MPDANMSIDNLAQYGLNKDNPPVSLPPNAFTDALNVRFRHGSAQKMSGEKVIERLTPSAFGYNDGEFLFIHEWANPNLQDDNTYYILVVKDNVLGNDRDHVILVRALPLNFLNPAYNEIGDFESGGTWQATTFQGGYAIILNNGLEVPQYLLDTEAGIGFANFTLKAVPGWDSYFDKVKVIDEVYDSALGTPNYSAGFLIDYTTDYFIVEAYDTSGALRGTIQVTADGTYIHNNANNNVLYVTTDATTNTTILTPHVDTTTSNEALLQGERFVVYRQSLTALNIGAGLIKSYGNLLIAGDLRVIDRNANTVIRQLPGLVRTSNVAAPGQLPTNWNPYASGANTADEIQLASTGIVQDMVPLNNQMIIYTDRSIHAINKTGNVTSPFSVTDITTSYGAMTLDSVIEFDGRHLVVGNNDIYLFGGNAGSIQSVAEGKVRDYFYRDLNTNTARTMFLLRNMSKDEIWINYPDATSDFPNKTLVWNYKSNAWSLRMMSEMRSGIIGRISEYDFIQGGDADTGPLNTQSPPDTFVSTAYGGDADDPVTGIISGSGANPFFFDNTRRYPIFVDGPHVYFAEAEGNYTNHDGTTYESRLARVELPLTPEFDVEHFKTLALWTTRKNGAADIPLSVYMQTHDQPTGDDVLFLATNGHTFTIGQDYKVELRAKGRFFDYVITDKPTTASPGVAYYWAISGMQAKIGKGGAR